MVSRRLNDLIRDPVRRSYLDSDWGFWADAILENFAFLEERGYTIEDISFHQNGASFIYRGPRGSVLFHFDPEVEEIRAEANLNGGLVSFEGDLVMLAQIHTPATSRPQESPLTREAIAEWVRYWADALRAAPELF